MSNFYENLAASRLGHSMLKSLGMPTPIQLLRAEDEPDRHAAGPVLFESARGSSLLRPILTALSTAECEVGIAESSVCAEEASSVASETGLKVRALKAGASDLEGKYAGLVFDATGLRKVDELLQLHRFFQPVMRRLAESGRVVILGRVPELASSPEEAAVCQALEGFCRSVGKEIGKRGATANLIQVADGAEESIGSALRFLVSARSAYVDGQVVRVTAGSATSSKQDRKKPLEGKTALVTGASRGIGEAIARTLHRKGARVIGVDVEAARSDLEALVSAIGGEALVADITAPEAPGLIRAALESSGRVDIVVHNAGITRDKMLANMPENWWTSTLDVNLGAVLRINRVLLEHDVIAGDGRIIGVSSMNGIAGQVGQTNYAASKAGTIGWVRKLAEDMRDRDITVNAVAPGFIETQMTEAIPLMTREIGRRMNSLSQGGKPVDVAEAIAFFAEPDSAGIRGNILRVCGQCVVGA